MKSFLLNATTWENSCGLATISHALTKTILSGPLGKQSAHPTVHLLEEAFSIYYQMPNLSLLKIRELLKYYLHPEDQQKIMIGPLKLLLNKAPGPNNRRSSTTSEITRLCKLLRISVKYDVFKGYKGDAPFCEVAARLNDNKWQPATQSISESFRQQKLWKEGFRHFTHHNPYELKKAVKQVLSSKHSTGQNKALQKAFVAQNYNRIALLSKAEANNFTQDQGFYAVISQAIQRRNICALLSMYYFKPSLRNYILHKAINRTSSAFVNDLLKIYYSLKQDINDTHQWDQELDKVLPCDRKTAGDTQLHMALRAKDHKTAKKLISAGEDIYQPNDNAVSPLHIVCVNEDKTQLYGIIDNEYAKVQEKGWLKSLLYPGVDLSQRDASGSTPLHYAANGTDPGFIDILLNRHRLFIRPINFRVRDNQGRTPIHLAALNSCEDILQQFLTLKRAHNAAHNDQDDLGLTPLHYAAAAKRHDNIRLLLRAGASVTVNANVNKLSEQFPTIHAKLTHTTPLWMSLEVNDLDGAALLISSVTQLWETRSSQGLNAIQLAAREGRIDLLKAWENQFHHSYLFRKADDNGQCLIHHAAMAGRVDVVKFLVSQGESLTRPDHRWNTPLHFAAQYGHVELVRYLCDEAKKEKDHNSSLARQGQVLEFLQKKRIMIQIDGENSFAETPHLLAQIHGHHEITKVLEHQGAKPVSLRDYLLKAIYRGVGDDASKSDYKAACIVAKRHTMAFETDAELNTLLHHAVKAGNYRAVLILLHPLKPEQRKALVLKKNSASQTPLALLNQIKRNAKDAQQKRNLDKIERAIIRYDESAFENKYPTAVQKGQYRDHFAQDFKEELEQTSAYYYASSASVYGPIILQGIAKAASATNPFLAPFAFSFGVLEAFFAGDTLDTAERSLALFAQKNPTVLPGVVSVASSALWWIGMYRQTTRRLTVAITKQVSARLLSQSGLENYNSESKNFMDYLSWLALVHAATEEVGRKTIANRLADHWEGLESSLEKVGMPKINHIVGKATEAANNVVKEVSGVDVQQTARRGYGWLRENVGSLPSVGAELLKVIDTEIMHDLAITEPGQQEAIKKVFEVTIDEYRHEPNQLEQVINGLRGYILTGEVSDNLLPMLSQTAQALAERKLDAGMVLAPLVTAGPQFKHQLLTDQDHGVLNAQAAEAINAGKVAEMFAKAAAKRIELLGQHVVTEQCLPHFGTQNTVIRDYLQQGLQALYVSSANDEHAFEEDVNAVSQYLNQGILTIDVAKSLDRLASALANEGKSYGEVIHALTLQNGFYKSFQGDVKLTTYSSRLQNSLSALQSVDANERGDKLYSALVKEHQYVIDSGVQSLQSGHGVYTEYKRILDQSRIRTSADGLSEYAAQILIFNNPLSFGNLTHEQKCQMQAFYRAYFNEMQGVKVNKDAVKKNFDRAQTFNLVAPYMELILSGAPVEANIPGIFAQWDPIVVRAAVAAHEVTAMVNTTPGYSVLDPQQSFNLFRKFFDQQYASSTQKVEQGMLDIVNETLRSHDQTGGHYQPIWGEHTLDSAAQFVSSSSKQIAQNRWQGTGDAYARSIGNNNKGKVHRFFSSVEKDVRTEIKREGKSSTGGLTTNGNTHSPTFFHTPSGTQTALNLPFGNKKLTFTMPSKVEPEALGKVVTSKPVAEKTPPAAQKLGTTSSYVPSLTKVTARTPIYTPLLAANDVRPSKVGTPMSQEPLGKVASAKKDTQNLASKNPSQPASQVPKTSNDAVTSLLAQSGPKKAEVKLVPELPRSLSTLPTANSSVTPPPEKISFGDRLLSFIGIGKAQANPVAIAGLAIAGATSIGAVMKPHQQDDRRGSNSRDEERRLTSPSYTGLLPNRDEIVVESTSFPAVSSGGLKTETLLNPPGLTSLVLTTPYFGLKKLQNIYNRNSQQESPGVYDHDYEKHQAKPGGGGALWGNDASLNPIPNKLIGQDLLDTSYMDSGKPNQRFNYYDGKVVKFRTSNDGRWHSYEVKDNVLPQVGDPVLKKFLKDKLITKSEYKKLLKK